MKFSTLIFISIALLATVSLSAHVRTHNRRFQADPVAANLFRDLAKSLKYLPDIPDEACRNDLVELYGKIGNIFSQPHNFTDLTLLIGATFYEASRVYEKCSLVIYETLGRYNHNDTRNLTCEAAIVDFINGTTNLVLDVTERDFRFAPLYVVQVFAASNHIFGAGRCSEDAGIDVRDMVLRIVDTIRTIPVLPPGCADGLINVFATAIDIITYFGQPELIVFRIENLLNEFPTTWDACKPNTPFNPALKELLSEISTSVGDIYDAWQYLSRPITPFTPSGVVDGAACLANATRLFNGVTGFLNFTDTLELVEHVTAVAEDAKDAFVSCRDLYLEQSFKLTNETDNITSCENGIILFVNTTLTLNVDIISALPNITIPLSTIIASGVNTASERCRNTIVQNFSKILDDVLDAFGSQNDCAGYVKDIITNLQEAFADPKNPNVMKLITVISKGQEFWSKCVPHKNETNTTNSTNTTNNTAEVVVKAAAPHACEIGAAALASRVRRLRTENRAPDWAEVGDIINQALTACKKLDNEEIISKYTSAHCRDLSNAVPAHARRFAEAEENNRNKQIKELVAVLMKLEKANCNLLPVFVEVAQVVA